MSKIPHTTTIGSTIKIDVSGLYRRKSKKVTKKKDQLKSKATK